MSHSDLGNHVESKTTKFKSCVANLGVENVDETISFYREKLGFEVVMAFPEEGDRLWGMVKRGDVTIMFQQFGSMKQEYKDLEIKNPSSSITFYIDVEDIQRLYDEIAKKVPLYIELHETFYGAQEFAIKDLNGYRLVFAEHKCQ